MSSTDQEKVTVAVVGAGAAGALTGVQLCDMAARRRIPLELVMTDPAPGAGRGTAYATADPRLRLNVPAGNMSCYPDDPDHFVRWLRAHGMADARRTDFLERHRFGSYVDDTLSRAATAAQGIVTVRRLHVRVTGCRCATEGAGHERVLLELADGGTLNADRVVLATGPFRRTPAWAPPELRASDRFITDPWAPGALDACRADDGRDIVLVGTGLTAVDTALLLEHPHRTVHAVSHHGRLPRAHAVTALPAVTCATELHGLPLASLRTEIRRHVSRTVRTHGDWRPALDGLRPVTAGLWASLSAEDRAEFLDRDRSWWNIHRHRMPPDTAEAVGRMVRTQRMRTHAGRIEAVERLADGSLTVRIDGRDGPVTLTAGWVVDCTGPEPRLEEAADPLWRSLVGAGLAVPDPLGMGVRTADGRLRAADGRTAGPLWTLGAPRRGELWETTAIPEIRQQAVTIAHSLLTHPAADAPARTAPVRRGRRPLDSSGSPLSTHFAAAAAYRMGVDLVLKVQGGAEDAFRQAVALDPGFALAHAAQALLGHEGAADVDVPRALADARRCARERADEHERSFVDVVGRRVLSTPDEGDAALLRHLDRYPNDELALAMAVPTIAFSGLRDLDGEMALGVVERTAGAQRGKWFHTSLLAFMRQETGHYDEAGELAGAALAAEPGSGHAMHALAHVNYECGHHETGQAQLDRWLAGQGRDSTHRAHFSWHAALHQLAVEDINGVRRRWAEQMSPRKVRGIRALVDSASLLWRARLAGSWRGPLPIGDVLETVPVEVREQPANAFIALHVAVALTAVHDAAGLRRLRAHALGADRAQREVIAALCEAFEHLLEERWEDASRRLENVLPRLRWVGGSAAQREIVEEALLYALVSAGRCDTARARLEARLDRRPSPHDQRRLTALAS
ncbi:FAD/NAD(P)-binding protein [Streptomyces sp. NPDC021218]|uniref:FAD/NAD(P)-binding protein n=1 Tax=unclassified Streptomyces TaxID=2593676 RepID=UPI0036C66932